MLRNRQLVIKKYTSIEVQVYRVQSCRVFYISVSCLKATRRCTGGQCNCRRYDMCSPTCPHYRPGINVMRYTPWAIKTCHFILDYNFRVSWWISTLCLPTEKRNIGPEMWPPKSPYLNPVDYSIWSVVEQRVYQERIQNTDELRQRLLTVWNNSSSRSLTMLSTSGKIVWQPVCEKRVGILSTHSKNSSLGLVLLSVDGIEH